MKRVSSLIFLGVFLMGAKAADPVEEVLAQGGLSSSDVHFDRELMDFYGGGPHRLRLFDLLANRPLDIPRYNRVFVHQLFEGQPAIARGIFFASLRTDESVRRGLLQHPYTAVTDELDSLDNLFTALDRLNSVAGNENVLYDFELPLMSAEVEQALTAILITQANAISYRDLAFRNLSREQQGRLLEKSLGYVGDDTTLSSEDIYFVEDCIGQVEYSLMYAGLEDLAMVLDTLLPFLDSVRGELAPMEFATPYGKVKIAGASDDSYQDEDYLLLIEVGGNDSYNRAGCNPDISHPLSVVIDLGGDDRYMNREYEPAIAAGVLGAGLVIDWRGKDMYMSNGLGLGGGLFGVGLLYDRDGDDDYDGFDNCQGAGVFGSGILVDVEGADTYRGFRGIQGYGFTKGCGLLLDLAGDDSYIARNDSVPFPSPQSSEHNANMAQGFGFGKRADFTDGKSLAGGVGVLADAAGNDIYEAGVFAQGCGYWYGVGMLTDKDGDDTYSGVWYVQGSGAHFAVGVLNDVEGNDEYNATKNMAQGAGHDFTVGYLLEDAGNDTYNAPNLSLGGGNANGLGVFWDREGDDTYNVTAGTTLGLANIGSRGGLRDFSLCLGMFMDTGGGNDNYPSDKPARNNKVWFQPGRNTDEPLDTEVGVGIDK